MSQKIDYIHYNPVNEEIVDEPEYYWYSSARDYAGRKGLIDVELLGKARVTNARQHRGSLVITATTNGNHSTTVTPLPNWNNPAATSTHYPSNGGTGIDTGAVNGVSVSNLDSASLATWRVAMDSAGATENLGPWTDKQHGNHFHNSFKQDNP